jgi:oligoendopeptidase F
MPYDALINYRLYSDLNTIMLCLMIDEFESRIYSMDVSNFTAADFDAVMESVATQYFKMSYINENMTDINKYWRAVVVDQPVYYISYGISAMASIGLYSMAVEDFDAALAAYQTLCENPQEDLVFLGNIAAVGLNGPFDEEFYIELLEILNSRS